jgi:ABC-type glutathione transport system ATPase component
MPAHALIELRDVDIAADSLHIVRRLSLDVAPGRVLAIVSERADVRTALTAVLSGAIDGYSVEGDLTMEGRELVARVTSQSATQAEQFVARISGPAEGRIRVRDVAEAPVLAKVALGGTAISEQRVNALDRDDRIRAAFAVALSGAPRLLVLDLPYCADAENPYATYSGLIQRLSRDSELAIVVCTDSLAVAADLADDVLITMDGSAVEYGSVYDICLRPAMPYTQDLLRVTPTPHRALPDFTAFVDFARHDGCPWVLNCRESVVRACSQLPPSLKPVAPGHTAACHLLGVANGT